MQNFNEFGLPAPLLEILERLEFKTPTAIQARTIPVALEGKDILAIAPTGTGKTGAFGIPALSMLYNQLGKQILVLAPTRELAAQTYRFLHSLGGPLKMKGTLIVGGESFYQQRNKVKAGVDFIVATPGRLMDHIGRGMPTDKIGVLVLDEVDRMLDMGFAPQVREIAKILPKERQTYLFSATLPPEIMGLVEKYLKDPVRISVAGLAKDAPKIKEERIGTTDADKPKLLVEQINLRQGKIIIFVNTQGRVEQVTRRLGGADIDAVCMHGGRTHSERKAALEAFRNGDCRVLVATDIVARGIDVNDVEHVINYDYPATKEDYLHRIGRTGRIGKEGSALTFMDPRRAPRMMRDSVPPRRARGVQGGDRLPPSKTKARRPVAGAPTAAELQLLDGPNEPRSAEPTEEKRSPRFEGTRPERREARPSFGARREGGRPERREFGARPARGRFGDGPRREEHRAFGSSRPPRPGFDGPRREGRDERPFGRPERFRPGFERPNFGPQDRNRPDRAPRGGRPGFDRPDRPVETRPGFARTGRPSRPGSRPGFQSDRSARPVRTERAFVSPEGELLEDKPHRAYRWNDSLAKTPRPKAKTRFSAKEAPKASGPRPAKPWVRGGKGSVRRQRPSPIA